MSARRRTTRIAGLLAAVSAAALLTSCVRLPETGPVSWTRYRSLPAIWERLATVDVTTGPAGSLPTRKATVPVGA